MRYYDETMINRYYGELPEDVDPNDPVHPVFHLDDEFKAHIADIIRSARAPHPLTDDILAIINEELSALRSRPRADKRRNYRIYRKSRRRLCQRTKLNGGI